MKRFLSFVHKEFLHIFRDKVTMLILLVMPVVLIVLFGFAVTTEVKSARIIVADRMQNDFSHKAIDALKANKYTSVELVTTDESGTIEAMRRGEIDLALVMDPDRGLQILADGSEPNQAQTRANYVNQILTAQQDMASAPASPVETHYLFNPQLKSEYNFVPGVIGMIIMLICALMTSVSIVREKEMGTMEILLASPLHPLVIIVSKLLPYFVVSSVNLASILLISKYILGIPLAGSIWTFLLISMVYILVALSLGLLISVAVDTQLAAMLLSLLLIVPTMYLSGLAFPLESMPRPFEVVSHIVPTRWYIDAARKLLIQGVEFRYVVEDLWILSLQAVLLIGISFSLFKTRLE